MIEIGIEIGILLSALIVVIVTFFVLRVIGIPYHIDPFGKSSIGLIENLNISDSKNEAVIWRKRKIDEAARKNEKVLLAKVGEFGKGEFPRTYEYALDKGFSVTVVSGNITWPDSKLQLKELLKNKNFRFYVLDYRPEDHFTVIGKSHLFIEAPHEHSAKIKHSLGVSNAHKSILNKFNVKFEDAIKNAKKVDNNFVESMLCFPDEDKKSGDDDV